MDHSRPTSASRNPRGVRAKLLVVLTQAVLVQASCLSDDSLIGDMLNDPALPNAIGEIATAYVVDALL